MVAKSTKNDGTVWKFALLGPYGVGNLGDASIVEAAIWNLRRYCRGCKIYGININPEDTLVRHGISSLPIHRKYNKSTRSGNFTEVFEPKFRRFRTTLRSLPVVYSVLRVLKRVLTGCGELIREIGFFLSSCMKIRGFDLLIVNGSGQLCDLWGGAWLHPYALFKWALIAKVARVPFIVMSVGAGPIESALSRFFLRHALRMADYRSFRDGYSKEIAISLGVKGKNHVFPDIAFGLPVDARKRCITERSVKMVVGVNPMAYYDPRCWPKNDPEVYRSYIRKLADTTSWLMGKGHKVVLFSSDRMDSCAIADVEHLVRDGWVGTRSPLMERAAIASLDALILKLNDVDAVVATRLHSLLLSSLLQKPVLAISPQKKVEALMDSLGQKEFVIDIRQFTLEEFQAKFTLLEGCRETIATEIGERVSRFREELGVQFQKVLAYSNKLPTGVQGGA